MVSDSRKTVDRFTNRRRVILEELVRGLIRQRLFYFLYVGIAIKNNSGSTFVSRDDGDALVSFEGGHSISRGDLGSFGHHVGNIRTNALGSGGMGWIDSMFPTELMVSDSAVLNFIPRFRIDNSATLRVRWDKLISFWGLSAWRDVRRPKNFDEGSLRQRLCVHAT